MRNRDSIDLDPEWFSRPLPSLHIFNLALKAIGLKAIRYEGSACIIRSKSPLAERDEEGLRRLIPIFCKAAIELGEELKEYNDFVLID